MISKEKKAEIIAAYGRKPGDTGDKDQCGIYALLYEATNEKEEEVILDGNTITNSEYRVAIAQIKDGSDTEDKWDRSRMENLCAIRWISGSLDAPPEKYREQPKKFKRVRGDKL
mgnify:CR=1 FL=1